MKCHIAGNALWRRGWDLRASGWRWWARERCKRSPCDVGHIFPQVFAIADGDPVGTIHFHHVLVKLPDFNHNARLIPFGRVWANKVLQADTVADDQGW